jgi:hypothetical protein
MMAPVFWLLLAGAVALLFGYTKSAMWLVDFLEGQKESRDVSPAGKE